ncbi:fimbria/pilus periplasmic chaperone [Pseudotabrizicola sp. 4114]|uniref:fimbrial biogenesis chaperone n=1 Tax=Pseudotabrizicola sp. 4114 TaxID=2817731 RepID=UPI0028678F7A|nr:fimbrial chaperone protein [Pseudorhodobacter sp. 4114]
MSMFARSKICAAVLLSVLSLAGPALANEFTVSPTSIKVAAGTKTATLTVKAGGPGATLGQVRVMRWHRDGGKNRLTATRDVVASPPAMRMAPNQELTIRLVRTAKSAVRGEECYRVLVDQLPGSSQQDQVVKFTVRHSVPLCFGPPV